MKFSYAKEVKSRISNFSTQLSSPTTASACEPLFFFVYRTYTHEDSVITCSVDPVRHTLDSAQHPGWHTPQCATPRTAHNPVAHAPGGAQPDGALPERRTVAHNPVAHTTGGAQPGGAHLDVRTPPAGHTPGVAQPREAQPG